VGGGGGNTRTLVGNGKRKELSEHDPEKKKYKRKAKKIYSKNIIDWC
jgi:hypothetical protein